MINHCIACNKEFKRDRFGRFCNSSCSASYNNKNREHSKATKDKISNTLLSKNCKEPTNCIICNTEIRNNRKTCSKECSYKYRSNINKGRKYKTGHKAGGYRNNSGNGKSGYYKGFYVSSTWECAFLIYCIENNIVISRCNLRLSYNTPEGNKIFHPDFFVNNEIIEIKGPRDKYGEYKKSTWGHIVKFFYLDDLIDIFKWVENTTGIKISNLYTIYDISKPYNPKCLVCGTEVKKKINKFCSNKCSMHHRWSGRRDSNPR